MMSADEWLVSVVVIRTVCCCDILQKCVFIQNFTEMDKTREKVAENFVDAVSATVSKIRILTHSSKSKISLNWNRPKVKVFGMDNVKLCDLLQLAVYLEEINVLK